MVSGLLSQLIVQQASEPDRLESHIYKQLFDKIRFGTYGMGEKLLAKMISAKSTGFSTCCAGGAL